MIDLVLEFFLFGFYGALISTLVKITILYIKLINVYNSNIGEYNDFRRFNVARSKWVFEKNSLLRITLSMLLYFVPGHALMLNGVFIFIALKHKGSFGIIKGMIASEQLSFIPLIKFKTIPVYK